MEALKVEKWDMNEKIVNEILDEMNQVVDKFLKGASEVGKKHLSNPGEFSIAMNITYGGILKAGVGPGYQQLLVQLCFNDMQMEASKTALTPEQLKEQQKKPEYVG